MKMSNQQTRKPRRPRNKQKKENKKRREEEKRMRQEKKEREEREREEMKIFGIKVSKLVISLKSGEIRPQKFLDRIWELCHIYAHPPNFCVVCANHKKCTTPVGFPICEKCEDLHSSPTHFKGYLNIPALKEGKMQSSVSKEESISRTLRNLEYERREHCNKFSQTDAELFTIQHLGMSATCRKVVCSILNRPCDNCSMYFSKMNKVQDY